MRRFSHDAARIISKLATGQYFTHDKYVSLASFTGNSFFQMMWLANFQLANSQTCNSQTRWLTARTLPRLMRQWLGLALSRTRRNFSRRKTPMCSEDLMCDLPSCGCFLVKKKSFNAARRVTYWHLLNLMCVAATNACFINTTELIAQIQH